MSMKNSNDTTGNRIPDRPIYSAVPQPTVRQRSPKIHYAKRLLFLFYLCQDSNVRANVASVWNMTLNQEHFGTIRNILGGNTEYQNEAHDETNTDITRLTQESRSGMWSASRLNDYAYGQMYVLIAGNTVEVQTQTPAHRHLIGRTMTTPSTVIAQQYSSAIFFSLTL